MALYAQPKNEPILDGRFPAPSFLFLGSTGFFDLITRTPFFLGNATDTILTMGPGGRALEFTVSSTNSVAPPYASVTNDVLFPDYSNAVILTQTQRTATQINAKQEFGYYKSDTDRVTVTNQNDVRKWCWGTATGALTVTIPQTFNIETIAYSANKLRGKEIWMDGKLIASDSEKNARVSNNSRYFYIGGSSALSAYAELQKLYLLTIFPTGLTQSQIQELTTNPWAMFKEPPKIFQVPVSFYLYAGSGLQTLVPNRYDTTHTFYAPAVTKGVITLTPARYDPTHTFYAPSVTKGTVTLTPSRYDSAHTFYAPTVTLSSGPKTLTPDRYDSTHTFYTPTVTRGVITLTPSRFDEVHTFYSHTVIKGAVTLTPARYNSAHTFYAPTVIKGAVTLTPSRFDEINTFYSSVITGGVIPTQTLTTARFDNIPTFYAHTITGGAQNAAIINGADMPWGAGGGVGGAHGWERKPRGLNQTGPVQNFEYSTGAGKVPSGGGGGGSWVQPIEELEVEEVLQETEKIIAQPVQVDLVIPDYNKFSGKLPEVIELHAITIEEINQINEEEDIMALLLLL